MVSAATPGRAFALAHRELTSAVSHELRTPLSRFKFSLQMLSNDPPEAKRRRYLDSMKDDVLELESLTDEMLSYARLSESNLTLARKPVDLRVWLSCLLRQYSNEKLSVHVNYDTPSAELSTPVYFDPDLMARAVHNVLRNAVRYAQSEVRLVLRSDDELTEIRIYDDGSGIPEEMRQQIFEPFARLDTSRDRQSGGHGLGLAIAQRILQRHGGGVYVEANVPAGACFVLRWPAQRSTSLEACTRSNPGAELHSFTFFEQSNNSGSRQCS